VAVRAKFIGKSEAVAEADPESGAQSWTRPLEHENGIPARDLTDEDWAALTPDERDVVRKSHLYEVATAAEARAERSAETREARKEAE
jgi:hypothetical protein